ncbi:hypothetical protein TUM4644_19840 [Shewanella colwelliana]|uniref:DUF4870 domain-containing protein n=1 Tax=Shewanella colwelliana TaxID=23 RepID=A0A1E5IQG0_SHECO|nr:hypothetical protein [Shewanella colwelliana]MDX1280610.1 hypothetical protein [Shewanella colwelliana]OEG72804.1 hypothetical protein BEL05_11075 [Shewanella colwelliana]GIU24941.1 hypothetical protein TUM4644_19840 [Shewanella colwelliana]GIU41819.1 hypothetical protein TUM3794_23680 [Shewanella colwelliana]
MHSTTSPSVAIDDHSLGHLLYAMMAAFPLLLLPPLLGLLINVTQKRDHMSPLLYSHIRWQRWSIVTMLSIIILATMVTQVWIAICLVILGALWFCHRIIKGWLQLLDGQTI